MNIYFDNNVFADLALNRIPYADKANRKVKEAVSDKRIVIIPSTELLTELVPVSPTDDSQFKRRWRYFYKLVDWSNTLKPANELLKDDIISFAKTGRATNPYVTRKDSYYEDIEFTAKMKEPPSAMELQQLTQQVYTSKGNFADVINQAGKDWYGKEEFPPDFTFDQYWSEKTESKTDESNSFAKKFIIALAESIGVSDACRARGLNKLLSLPTVLLPVGFWTHSWFDQVTKGRKEKASVALDFRHCTLAAAVGTFVTGDTELRHVIQELPGHNVNVMSLSELVAKL